MLGHNHQQVYNWVVDAGDEDDVVGNAGDVLLVGKRGRVEALMGERSGGQILLVMNGMLLMDSLPGQGLDQKDRRLPAVFPGRMELHQFAAFPVPWVHFPPGGALLRQDPQVLYPVWPLDVVLPRLHPHQLLVGEQHYPVG